MELYKRGGHTVWDRKYYIVWVTKYRYPVPLRYLFWPVPEHP